MGTKYKFFTVMAISEFQKLDVFQPYLCVMTTFFYVTLVLFS